MNSRPPSYVSDEEVRAPGPVPRYTVSGAPPVYKPVPKPEEELARAYLQAAYQPEQLNDMFRLPRSDNVLQHLRPPPNAHRFPEYTAQWKTWQRAVLLFPVVGLIFLAMVFSLTILLQGPSSDVGHPYVYEMNNTNVNLTSFADSPAHLNMAAIEEKATEVISVPDFIRFGISEYCTDDDPEFSNPKCMNYHSWNDYGDLRYVYSVLMHEATGKKMAPGIISLPSPKVLRYVTDERDYFKGMVIITEVIHGLALPIVGLISIAITFEADGMMLCLGITAAACGFAAPFSIAAVCLYDNLISQLSEAFALQYEKYGISVNPSSYFRGFCIGTMTIDIVLIVLAACFLGKYYYDKSKASKRTT